MVFLGAHACAVWLRSGCGIQLPWQVHEVPESGGSHPAQCTWSSVQETQAGLIIYLHSSAHTLHYKCQFCCSLSLDMSACSVLSLLILCPGPSAPGQVWDTEIMFNHGLLLGLNEIMHQSAQHSVWHIIDAQQTIALARRTHKAK